MKSKLTAVLILLVIFFFIGCEFESQPTENSAVVGTNELSKKPINSELISFTGDLAGSQIVENCCPNGGSFPEYQMTFSGNFEELSGTYEGNIFMNNYGRGKNKSYIVQFWTETMFLEIIGGDVEKDKQTKTTTVTFTNETCEITIENVTTTIEVSFVITRAPAQ